MNIVGITKDNFVLRDNTLEEHLTDNLHFHGKKTRGECISIISNSDFTIIPRQRNKLTMFGFSSKICESFACGIPVITTDTSDNKLYIKNGINGFVCDPDYDSLKKQLAEIEKLARSQILQMHRNLSEENPLGVNKFIKAFSRFIDNLIV